MLGAPSSLDKQQVFLDEVPQKTEIYFHVNVSRMHNDSDSLEYQ